MVEISWKEKDPSKYQRKIRCEWKQRTISYHGKENQNPNNDNILFL